jgi:hypothetical protein
MGSVDEATTDEHGPMIVTHADRITFETYAACFYHEIAQMNTKQTSETCREVQSGIRAG